MIEDCDGECFTCRLTGLGFDLEQQVIVMALMHQTYNAGGAWVLASTYGEAARDIAHAVGRMEMPDSFYGFALERVMEQLAEPMSDEVAAAVHRRHR